ncbi:TraR/DksA family transcriptional regulator [Desulfonatronum thioautotrophicum]|uniref:TraR/DksA family transcriptional regulator n=1 Tax=Desulfonatronum thioautotrophicum TaxID=617001 RepID=UPI0005EBF134|nr:TraR/DksA C4-type zinc finger protein [Desulfonatronum thioautotrophicum]
MTHEQLSGYRQSLETLLHQTRSSVDRLGRSIGRSFPSCADDNDRGSQEEERRLLILQADRQRRLIQDIRAALLRMDQGDYGYCEACGEHIDPRRLHTQPTARFCVTCLKQMEESGGWGWAWGGMRPGSPAGRDH